MAMIAALVDIAATAELCYNNNIDKNNNNINNSNIKIQNNINNNNHHHININILPRIVQLFGKFWSSWSFSTTQAAGSTTPSWPLLLKLAKGGATQEEPF